MGTDDPFDLRRFLDAQAPVFATVLRELQAGRKRTHWMWFIFPQLRGLGRSATAEFYGITSVAEARAYLAHPLLGTRLTACVEAVIAVDGRSVNAIFGSPDDMKFHSSMTLFDVVAPATVFWAALQKYCDGVADPATLALIGR